MSDDYRKIQGRIFDIQKYSIHDGPGIRTIVFLKGCPLRCKWCCNPEAQIRDIQIMVQGGKEKTVGRDVSVEEVMEEVMKDSAYYRRSGGGLTLSGGECLLQPDFAGALLRAAKENGLHTAIESTGFAKFETIQEKILPWLDLYLMDIKHMDSKKHKMFTSQPNERILENARKITDAGQKLIVRVPVIPTFNDTPEEIYAIAQFARSLKGVEEMNLLPYHRLGQDKYAGIGREYTLAHLVPPSNEHMEMLKEVAESAGIRVKIGG